MGIITFCKFSDETIENIWEWCHKHQVPNPTGKSRLHTSVMWSKTDVPEEHWIHRDVGHLRKMTFLPVGLELFDHFSKRQQVMQKCLVIKLHAPYLTQCHKYLIKQGATYGHPTFIPHVTVCYNFPPEMDLSKIELPKFHFQPNKIFTENFVPLVR